MPWDGSGNFNRTNGDITSSTLWADLDADGVRIRSDHHDLHDQDLADGLGNCLLKDGTNSPTANLPMGTNKHTGVADATSRSHYLTVKQNQDAGLIFGGDSTSTGSGILAYAITISNLSSNEIEDPGNMFIWRADADNPSATDTLNINSSGAKTLTFMSGNIAPGDIKANKMVVVSYDAINDAWQIINPRD